MSRGGVVTAGGAYPLGAHRSGDVVGAHQPGDLVTPGVVPGTSGGLPQLPRPVDPVVPSHS